MIETARLRLREFTGTDTEFVIALLNDPDWIKNIGDKHVRTTEDARTYLENGPMTSYRNNGFGLYAVEVKHDQLVIGTCGLIKRPGLDDVDIGFAFLPEYRALGYALEATAAVLEWAEKVRNLSRVLAIVLPENRRSVHLLEKLGMNYEKEIVLPGDPTPLSLYSIDL